MNYQTAILLAFLAAKAPLRKTEILVAIKDAQRLSKEAHVNVEEFNSAWESLIRQGKLITLAAQGGYLCSDYFIPI